MNEKSQEVSRLVDFFFHLTYHFLNGIFYLPLVKNINLLSFLKEKHYAYEACCLCVPALLFKF
jgi:hypothetical protein